MNVAHVVDRLRTKLGVERTTRGLERVEACLEGFRSGARPADLVPLHEPTRVYFPGLTARPWHERDRFPWIAAVEQKTPEIRRELDQLLAGGARFYPYEDPYTLELGWSGWDTFCLYRKGKPYTPNARRCPTTMEVLGGTPHGPRQGMFSRLQPGAHLAPHSGGVNVVLTCHLGLVVPTGGAGEPGRTGCGLRAGDLSRPWVEGEVVVFDDSFVHEAWNFAAGDRVVLLWDLWHPDLTGLEVEALTLVFSTFDQIMRHLGG